MILQLVAAAAVLHMLQIHFRHTVVPAFPPKHFAKQRRYLVFVHLIVQTKGSSTYNVQFFKGFFDQTTYQCSTLSYCIGPNFVNLPIYQKNQTTYVDCPYLTQLQF